MYRLLALEEKSEWGARRNLVWTSFVWDTVGFKLWVTDDKLARMECLLEDLQKERGEMVKVRKIARVAGVIGSFTLAMGNVARFYTRGMLSQVAERVGRAGWESCVKMDGRVLEEIEFWRQNLRSLNGWRMHEDEDIVYCKEGCVDMF